FLALEDGFGLEGESIGAASEGYGEAVFNTSMSGYQEILTDPSYKGQIITMTYPLIGNYGVNREDVESHRPWAEGFVVKESSTIHSNWRSSMGLDEYLKKNNIAGIEGVDTRALTRHLRTSGAMKAIISSRDLDKKRLVKKAKGSSGLVGRDLVKEVVCKKAYDWKGSPKKGWQVVVIDCGVKYNIPRSLARVGCRVKIVPAGITAKEILGLKPDGVVLSNGPGDPEPLKYVIEAVQGLIGHVPIFGICLGHQMLGLAFGGKTYKLKFGHHGANHPVKDLSTGEIKITSQNHGFCVDIDSIPDKNIKMTHVNLYDHTPEGLEHKKLPIFSVQYHPEASPGPHDADYLFKKFVGMMKNAQKKRH
ncbi:MAG: glutamine-hydrolyzing carbamoyl-phosphate synthase small subunit, partial [Candidatus Omnitrophica bacterium]|nr:glutamine-hydrolyzing carbamoyl-phosphate synthase small subunit [Candidatus Omnitrophota bacterium]